ncbi:hypothetical protein FN846DRAFT_909964 [Sphaerosporella brunnea]|uniref:Uncharacterized protein n=1 Tax=Sphaerosporella brunnea TaxID=1250544 RepID=A0A5J5EPP7_9PEZI|nr:hypothetical protein FN846DRAFT_909964 [Sphaerosporella brunnea]
MPLLCEVGLTDGRTTPRHRRFEFAARPAATPIANTCGYAPSGDESERPIVIEDADPATASAIRPQRLTHGTIAIYSDGSHLEDRRRAYAAVTQGENHEAYNAELLGIASALKMATRRVAVRANPSCYVGLFTDADGAFNLLPRTKPGTGQWLLPRIVRTGSKLKAHSWRTNYRCVHRHGDIPCNGLADQRTKEVARRGPGKENEDVVRTTIIGYIDQEVTQPTNKIGWHRWSSIASPKHTSATETTPIQQPSIALLAAQLGSRLNRNYTGWNEVDMARLVQDVTAALNKHRANRTHAIPAEAVYALIHRLCLDNVRTVTVKSRRKRSSSKTEDAADSDGDDDDEMTAHSALSATKEPASAMAMMMKRPRTQRPQQAKNQCRQMPIYQGGLQQLLPCWTRSRRIMWHDPTHRR